MTLAKGAGWRLAMVFTLALFAWPFLAPCLHLFSSSAWANPGAPTRILFLATNTAQLVAGTLLFALPFGASLAVFLERTNLPGKRLLGLLVWCPLFIPLPLLTSGWQSILGIDGFLPAALLSSSEYAPWSLGLGSAIWIHALAAFPWVVLILRSGLAAVEPDLEEDALLVRPPLWVLWHVTLSRSGTSLAAAAVWVSLLTAGEISVADVMQVRTFAEEVNLQLVSPQRDPDGGDPLGRAVVVSLLWVVLVSTCLFWLSRSADRLVPPGVLGYRRTLCLRLGFSRWPLFCCLLSLLLAGLLIPLSGLVYRAGVTGDGFSFPALAAQLRRAFSLNTALLSRSLLAALLAGMTATSVALGACWLSRNSRTLRFLLLALVAVSWATPGPVVGLGTKEVFRYLVEWSLPFTSVVASSLWYGPSPLPVITVHTLRFFPCAVAILWPVVRLVPHELFEQAALDGLGPSSELRHVIWPLTAPACLLSALCVTVLSLGEISAAKLVSTPGADTFAEVVWTQMHYGLSPDLASRCLFLLVVVLGGSFLVLWARSSLARHVSV